MKGNIVYQSTEHDIFDSVIYDFLRPSILEANNVFQKQFILFLDKTNAQTKEDFEKILVSKQKITS